ncbi:MAG: HDIG domain-containing protein [Saprospiraceae bacterium]|nr:HDIG domain-containing protein [Saprospiraceae bacterium]
MSKWKTALEGLPTFFKYLLVLGVVVFISFLFPNNVKFKYNFEKGQRWRYQDLEAPFDFAIKKSEEEIQDQIDELRADFHPYYELDRSVPERQIERFKELFANQLSQVRRTRQFEDVLVSPRRYLDYGLDFLDEVYESGLIRLAPEHQDSSQQFQINLFEGNTTRTVEIGRFVRLTEARDMLSDSLPYSRLEEAEFLFPLLEEVLQPNITYDRELTEQFWQDQLDGISTTRGMVQKGELIVAEDGIVTEEVYQKLVSLKEQYEMQVTENKSRLTVFIGYFLLTSLIVGVFLMYLMLNNPKIMESFSKLLFVMMWLVIYSYLVYLVENTDILSTYMIPFCIVPIVIKTFFYPRLALFTHIVIVLIASFLSSLGYEFTFMQILAGIVVLLSDVDTRDWSRFFYSMLFIFLAYSLSYLGLSLIQEGALADIDWTIYNWIFLNVFLTLLAYPLIPLLERFFGFTSAITLVELSDMNRPLLQRLAIDAPGTLQHSLQVANLSEAAARKIGADTLLVKVAALYHDIGKTIHPEYFIENQGGRNPHEEISFLESAKIIIGHVTEGIKMARKARLPKVLVDFISTHHGTTRTEYFYRNYLQENPEAEVDESQFRYPGPRPATKEETILMLADSIEAACKSLKSPTEKAITELIDKIVSDKVTHGQLENSEMTFSELEECKRIFKQVMKSVHHTRIEYPEEKEKKTEVD